MGFRVVGVELKGGAVVPHGFLGAAGLQQRAGESASRIAERRLAAQGRLVVRNRARRIARAVEEAAEIGVGLGVVGLEPDDCLQFGDGAVGLVVFDECVGPMKAREGEAGPQLQRALGVRDGLLGIAKDGERGREIAVGLGKFRFERDRGAQVFGPGRDLPRLHERGAEVIVGEGMFWSELQGGTARLDRVGRPAGFDGDRGDVVERVGRIGIEAESRLVGGEGGGAVAGG